MKALLEQNLFTCLGLTVFLWSFHYAQTSLRARKRGISAGGLGHGSVSLAAAELFQRTLLATGRPGSVSWLKLQACPQPFCEQGVLCHLPPDTGECPPRPDHMGCVPAFTRPVPFFCSMCCLLSPVPFISSLERLHFTMRSSSPQLLITLTHMKMLVCRLKIVKWWQFHKTECKLSVLNPCTSYWPILLTFFLSVYGCICVCMHMC